MRGLGEELGESKHRLNACVPDAPVSCSLFDTVASEAELVAPASAPNRRMVRSKLKYSPEKDGKTNEANGAILGPVAIFWDYENCHVPKDTKPEDVYANVIRALGGHQFFTGSLTKFGAYGDFSCMPKIKESLHNSGIKIHQVPRKKMKDAADLVILSDMFFFAMDNPVPASVVLISGDGDFAPSLHGLHQRVYNIAVAIWSTIHSSPDLTRPADVVWDWPLLARGHGFGVPKRISCPSDLQKLKVEMIKVLESAEQKTLPLSQVLAEYSKNFLRPLVITNYDCTDVGNLLEKLDPNLFIIFGGGVNKAVYLYSAPEESGGCLDLGSSQQTKKAEDNETATYTTG